MNKLSMKVPQFFKLPSYYVFNYTPRYYDKKKAEREARSKSLKFRNHLEEHNPNISDQFTRSKVDSMKGMTRLSTIIRITLIALFVLVAWLVAKYMGIMISG